MISLLTRILGRGSEIPNFYLAGLFVYGGPLSSLATVLWPHEFRLRYYCTIKGTYRKQPNIDDDELLYEDCRQ
jgi:hypothetical protein